MRLAKGGQENKMNYTPKQLEILKIIKQSQQDRGYSPTYAEIAKIMDVSPVTIFEHVRALEKKGAITRRKYEARSMELSDPAFDTTAKDTPSLRESVRDLLKHADVVENGYMDMFEDRPSDDYVIPVTLGQLRKIRESLLAST
jgi:repressor LexA